MQVDQYLWINKLGLGHDLPYHFDNLAGFPLGPGFGVVIQDLTGFFLHRGQVIRDHDPGMLLES